MHDWRNLVRHHLKGLRLSPDEREDVCSELADHLEDLSDHLVASGLSQKEAIRRTLEFASQWKALKRGIKREKEGIMTLFGRQVILPGGLALVLATIALAVESHFGPRPAVLSFAPGTLVVYHVWPVTLLAFGAMAAFLSIRAGANATRGLFVALSPALIMFGVMVFVLLVAIPMHLLRGVRPDPQIFLYGFLNAIENWVVLPAIPLLLGALPFLKKPAERHETFV